MTSGGGRSIFTRAAKLGKAFPRILAARRRTRRWAGCARRRLRLRRQLGAKSSALRLDRFGSSDGVSGYSRNAQRRKALARGGDRDVDAAASILDHDHDKTLAARVLRRVAHAEIEREPRNEDSRQASLAQITRKAGGGLAVVLVEG